MASKDPRIDAYISEAEAFAQPVLKHLRKLVHQACPDIEETMKWSFPHFDYKGILCSMASFKQHCVFGFWKASLMKDSNGILEVKDKASMGSLGRLTSLKDLPADKVLLAYIKEAVKLNDDGVKPPAREKTTIKKLPEAPGELVAALKRNKKAQAHFDAFSPSQKKEYIEWIVEAKTEATRLKRLETALEWIAEGKTRNWKYK